MMKIDIARIQNVLQRLHARLESIRKRIQPHMELWLGKLQTDPTPPEKDFVADADYFMIQQEPLRARILVKTISVVLALSIMYAAVAHVDEITKGEGKVIPSRQLQVLQSVDGGIVSEILVREGQIVDAGQMLVRVDPTRFESSVNESNSQIFSLQAKAARLRALTEGKPFEPPPEAEKNDPKTVAEERRLFESRVSELNAQLSIARQQLSQRQQELVEMRAKRDQASQAYELSSRELVVTKPLISAGAVSEVELLRLERDVGRFRGERDMAAAQIQRSQAAISEASRKIEEVELAFRNESGKELAETIAKLNAMGQSGVGLADKVKHAAIRSPVRGTVKRLLVNTVGGVVQPGKDIVEVVPLEDALLLEAKVHPKDIAFLHPGQKAIVRFTAYDFAIYGGMDAVLEHIGADTVTDDKGNTYYIVRVRTTKASFADNLPIIPGMVAEVDIITGQKSILSYLLKPVLRAKLLAFTER
ncbi:HlyD family type I secretion periplasmic adaptor subunit [Sulfurisoma sediminicola]|uniref:Membrane fusion protein (MFP) family protein n=1 Tax=Sulfurisoma sediminicola TaxID=1381557 RepID=A0A497XPI0_9PROT|nr:HlyD family type I secretion periplasmic adaptor subunit [Sulfurisoma sediminicola]RLJ68268.1 adhesin transport system membrane fusion protein [Sulfurisoma sediminicola]